MPVNLNDVHHKAYDYYKIAYKDKVPKNKYQQRFNELWNQRVNNKDSETTPSREEKEQAATKLLAELKTKADTNKSQNLLSFLKPTPCSNSKPSVEKTVENSGLDQRTLGGLLDKSQNQNVLEVSNLNLADQNFQNDQSIPKIINQNEDISTELKTKTNFSYKTPAQDTTRQEIENLKIELKRAELIQNSGLDKGDLSKKIYKLKEELTRKENHLKALQQNAQRQKKHRDEKTKVLKTIIEKESNYAKVLKVHNERGQPPLETNQPELLKTITRLVTFGASAEPKRRNESLNSCKTLEQLQKELIDLGYEISKTALYYRLMPKNPRSHDAKRHVSTVPVRLRKAQSDLHKSHPDQNFCRSTIRSLETLASILGPNQAIFLSKDDKARVPLGITAANKQAPILMHFEYQVRLPDHDWVIAERHKLIPSVYAFINIKADDMGRPEAVSYSGPTYIAIRSGKHSTSSASTHAADFDRLTEIPSFKNLMFDEDGIMKPVVFQSVDGGPDENPRYPKVIKHAIEHFSKYDMDAMFVFTNAPGRSAFNRVERRMAPLSRELSSLILPHDHFGNHLNSSGKTVDVELEKKNFEYAASVLVDVWSKKIIDNYPVTAEYIQPDVKIVMPDLPTADWCAKHVRESQYLLQIVKCNNVLCCKPMRSSLKKILKTGFLPPPYYLTQSELDIIAPHPDAIGKEKFASLLLRLSVDTKPSHDGFIEMPYDYFCPSVKESLTDRVCKLCGLYFATKKAVKFHKEQVHGKISTATSKIRPVKIVAKRENEVLCHIKSSSESTEADIAEWHDEQLIECDNINLPSNSVDSDNMKVISDLETWMENPFIEDNEKI